jgi:DNA-binding NtrC family response regulator
MRSMTVLVVDDDLEFGDALAALLQQLGLNQTIARSGREALRLIDMGVDIDFVLTDVAMPGMSGLELQRTLSTRRPTLPVILMTGRCSALDASVPAYGATLLKPFSVQALLLAIENVASTGGLKAV